MLGWPMRTQDSLRIMAVREFRHIQSTLAQGGGGGGGAGYSTNFYTGRFRPEVQPLARLYTIFYDQGIPLFHIPCLELCIPFKCCKMRCRLNRNQSQQ